MSEVIKILRETIWDIMKEASIIVVFQKRIDQMIGKNFFNTEVYSIPQKWRKIGYKLHRIINQKDLSLIQESNLLYLRRITHLMGRFRKPFKIITENNLNLDILMSIYWDGTTLNAKRKNGAIRFF